MEKLKTHAKYLAALISASLTNSAIGDNLEARQEQMNLDAEKGFQANVLNSAIPLQLAAHRSHSSHRSHRSHSSHRSSSGGGYRAPAPYVPPSPPPAPATTPKPQQSVQSHKEASANDNSTKKSTDTVGKDELATVIQRIQLALTFEGFYEGDVDGIMGPKTREAITNYRAAKGLSKNAYIDAALLNSLGIYTPQ